MNKFMEQQVVKVDRVSKVVKGGKKISFRATVIVGNKINSVGVGIGKATEVGNAIKKAVNNAKKNLISIPLTKTYTIPHIVLGVHGASKVFIRPAPSGTGVIAGSSIRTVLELGGVRNIFSKQLGSKNLLNNAQATVMGLKSIKPQTEIHLQRHEHRS
uniref:Small ribosomal subunit protein uS5c n=1 Tax=Schizocladia ischiensis TaxID=196139 RepID=A0A7S6U9Y4_9STRA|nr:ribosomal protein S5 [Schizocladia ischiensis]QOW07550.1 ribosomal protein S5 [Schizocladia ischiensis]